MRQKPGLGAFYAIWSGMDLAYSTTLGPIWGI